MRKLAKTSLGFAVCLVASLVVCTVAYALTTFDPVTGLGFVGKGDLQTPWGWNNQTLQANAEDVTFSYESVEDDTYQVTCEFDTGTGAHIVHHVITHDDDISSSVAYDVTKATRKNPQGSVTGFYLLGPDGDPVVTESGSIPAVGDPCPGNSGLGLITDVEETNSTSSETLYASDVVAGVGPTAIWIDGVSIHP